MLWKVRWFLLSLSVGHMTPLRAQSTTPVAIENPSNSTTPVPTVTENTFEQDPVENASSTESAVEKTPPEEAPSVEAAAVKSLPGANPEPEAAPFSPCDDNPSLIGPLAPESCPEDDDDFFGDFPAPDFPDDLLDTENDANLPSTASTAPAPLVFNDIPAATVTLAKGLAYLRAAPTRRFAIALSQSHSVHKHISLIWYSKTKTGTLVPRMFDGTRWGIQQDATHALKRLSSLYVPTDPRDNTALRSAILAKSRRPNPRGTCLASVIGPARESLLQIAKRYFKAHLGNGGTDNPGEIFARSGLPAGSAWHFELFALKRPELLRGMGFELLATGRLLPPTLGRAPELRKLQNRVGPTLQLSQKP